MLIPTAKQFAEIKLLRTLIVRGYEPDKYTRIFTSVLQMAAILLDGVEKTVVYCGKL